MANVSSRLLLVASLVAVLQETVVGWSDSCDSTTFCDTLQTETVLTGIMDHPSSPITDLYEAFMALCVKVQKGIHDGSGYCNSGCGLDASYDSSYINRAGSTWGSEHCVQSLDSRGGITTLEWCVDTPATTPGLPGSRSYRDVCQPLVDAVFSSACWEETVVCSIRTAVVPTFESFVAYFEDGSATSTHLTDGHYLSLSAYSNSDTPSPSQTASASTTASISATASASASASTSKTASITASVSISISASPSPSMGHYFDNTNWWTLKMSDNLGGNYSSYLDTFPRDVVWPNILLWNDMDAYLTIECGTNQTDFDCDYVLVSSIRIMSPTGYTGVRLWSAYDDIGSSKILVAEGHYLWQSAVCQVDSVECILLDITDPGDGVDGTAYLEFRMGIYDGYDIREKPIIVEWIDETQIPHAMRPGLNRTLDWWEFYALSSGRDFGISELYSNSDMSLMTYVISTFLFVLLIIFLVSFFKKPIVRRKDRKLRYVLKTHGLRTIMAQGKNQIHRSKTYDRNRLSGWHVPFILVILAWRIAYSFVFTMTFFSYVFTSINSDHFNTMDQWNNFTEHRDLQITTLMANIETEYKIEKVRIQLEYEKMEEKCNVTTDMEVAFNYDYNTISTSHDSAQASRTAGNVTSGWINAELSNAYACSVTSSGAAYDENSLVATVWNSTTQSYGYQSWDVSSLSIADIKSALGTACEESDSCVAYGYNSATNDYHIFTSLGSPKLDPTTSGFCHAYLEYQQNWDSASNSIESINAANIAAYNAETSTRYTLYETVLASIDNAQDTYSGGSGESEIQSDLDQSTGNYSLGLMGIIDGSNGINFFVRYACPGTSCSDIAMPILALVSDPSYNYSEGGYIDGLNTTYSVETNFVDRVAQYVNFTEPDFDWLEAPDWGFEFYNIGINSQMVAVIISLDILLFIYRTMYTISILAKYIRGLEHKVPLYYVMGKQAQEERRSDIKKAFMFSCIGKFVERMYIKIQNMGGEVWMLVYKLNIILILCVLGMVGFIAYMVVDNIIQPETFEQFGVFSAMTAVPATQQTMRNEQIALLAKTYNSVGSSSLLYAIDAKGYELMDRQETFNSAQFSEVEQYNTDFCAAMKEYITVPSTLILDSPSGCCPSVVDDNQNTHFERVLQYDLDDTADGDDALYVAPEITIDLRWERPTEYTSAVCATKSDGSQYCQTEFEGCAGTVDLGSFKKALSVRVVMYSESGAEVYNTSQSWDALYGHNDETTDPCLKNKAILSYSPTTYTTYNFMYIPASETTTLTFTTGASVRAASFDVILQSQVDDYQVTDVYVSAQLYASADFECNEVERMELDFQVEEYLGDCQSISPVSAYQISLFSRSNWTHDLSESHKPFVTAMRNICLSPFYIVLVGLGMLIGVMLFLMLLEYFMIKADMIRENAFARVPCLIAKRGVDMSRLEHQRGHSLQPANASDIIMVSNENKRKSLKQHQRERAQSVVEPIVDPASLLQPAQSSQPVGRRTSMGKRASIIRRASLGGHRQSHSQGNSEVKSGGDPSWLAVRTDDGRTYYYNELTNETTWELPAGFVSQTGGPQQPANTAPKTAAASLL